jgi:dynein heavy chain
LESVVIHWTRQIREVVRETDGGESGADRYGGGGAHAAGRDVTNETLGQSLSVAEEDASDGPLAEVAFWHSRAFDLAGIARQLDDVGVDAIVRVLRKARSTYLEPFSELYSIVASELSAAEDNARFLNTLVPPCEALAKAKATEVAGLVPGISHRVRLVWNAAERYDQDRVFGLLRKISNEVMRRCAKDVSVGDILDGNVKHAVDALHASIEACDAWKTSFEFTRAAVNKRHAGRPKNALALGAELAVRAAGRVRAEVQRFAGRVRRAGAVRAANRAARLRRRHRVGDQEELRRRSRELF